MALIKLGAKAYKAGQVMQVVRKYTADSSHITTSSSTFVGSGFAQAITPTVVGSLLIINFNVSMADANDGSAAAIHSKMFYKTGSGSFASMPSANEYHIAYNAHAHNRYSPMAHSSSITTTTTDAYTFEPYIRISGGSGARFSHDKGSIGMTIFEVAQ